MDGWGGTLTRTIREKLTENNASIAGALGLAKRPPRVGQKFQGRGDYTLRAGGAEIDDASDDPATFDSSVMVVRESVRLTVCVQQGEDGDPLSLIPIAETFARIVLLEQAWLDPQFEFLEVVYPEETERALIAEAGFVMSARSTFNLTLFGE